MGDLISRQAAIDALIEWYGCEPNDLDAFKDIVGRLPSVQPKHGRWEKAYADHVAFGERPFYRYCSECCEVTFLPYKFCPNCGAYMMDEVEE